MNVETLRLVGFCRRPPRKTFMPCFNTIAKPISNFYFFQSRSFLSSNSSQRHPLITFLACKTAFSYPALYNECGTGFYRVESEPTIGWLIPPREVSYLFLGFGYMVRGRKGGKERHCLFVYLPFVLYRVDVPI